MRISRIDVLRHYNGNTKRFEQWLHFTIASIGTDKGSAAGIAIAEKVRESFKSILHREPTVVCITGDMLGAPPVVVSNQWVGGPISEDEVQVAKQTIM